MCRPHPGPFPTPTCPWGEERRPSRLCKETDLSASPRHPPWNPSHIRLKFSADGRTPRSATIRNLWLGWGGRYTGHWPERGEAKVVDFQEVLERAQGQRWKGHRADRETEGSKGVLRVAQASDTNAHMRIIFGNRKKSKQTRENRKRAVKKASTAGFSSRRRGQGSPGYSGKAS